MKIKKAIVAGHVCIDITPIFENNVESDLSQLFIPGKLIQMGEASVSTGGSVSNTGIAMKILGADVKTIGKLGCDSFGLIIKDKFKQYGLEDGLILDPDSSTSYSIVLAPPGIDRIFLHHPGANNTFSSEDINFEMLDDVSLFHFGYPPLMQKMYENNGEELVKLFKTVKSRGIVTSLDMAIPDPNSPAGKADWHTILKKLLPYVDFFMPSIEELGFMLDRKLYDSWVSKAAGRDVTEIIDIQKDVAPLGERLLSMGVKVVLIKCGAPGLFYCTAESSILKTLGPDFFDNIDNWSNKRGFERSYIPKSILSGTGAGDTTIAAFLTAVLNRYSLNKCLKLAAGTGASCVEAYDALSGLRSFDELERKIENGWKKR